MPILKKKVIEKPLSEQGIQEMIEELNRYKQEIQVKTNRLVERLTDMGYENVSARVSSIDPFYKEPGDISVSVSYVNGTEFFIGTIFMEGEEAVFVEFGAGVKHNTNVGGSLHPLAQDNGRDFSIGSWSYGPRGKGHADSPYGWWFKDSSGNWSHTYGTPTFAPLFNAMSDIRTDLQTVAKGVFNE